MAREPNTLHHQTAKQSRGCTVVALVYTGLLPLCFLPGGYKPKFSVQ